MAHTLRKKNKHTTTSKLRKKTLKGGNWEKIKRAFRLGPKKTDKQIAKPIEPPTQVSIQTTDEAYKNYMNDVVIKNETGSKPGDNKHTILANVMQKSFPDPFFFNKLDENITQLIPAKDTNDWENCLDKCYTENNHMVAKEIKSTAYMLKAITASFVVAKEDNKPGEKSKKNPKYIEFMFTGSYDDITGLWENDYKLFDIKINNPNEGEIDLDNLAAANRPKTGRLIMGFGPSASGKTHCASLVIELMRLIEPTGFPDFFLTIDGGVFREQSAVYQAIVAAANKSGIAGLSNLVSASFFAKGKTIFTSDIIKSAFRKYLAHQKEKGFIINLYVPETLGGCKKGLCRSKYSKYIDITGDNNWIGLMIYQHRTSCECPYTREYKCTGTTESGRERERQEGKKYSSGAWNWSYDNGNAAILEAPKYRFRIHNVGKHSGTHSLFEDLCDEKINTDSDELQKFFNHKNLVYIAGKVKTDDNCSLYSTECIHKPKTIKLNTTATVLRAAKAFSTLKKSPSNVKEPSAGPEEPTVAEELKEPKVSEEDNEYESNV
jgi:hypothetical protein